MTQLLFRKHLGSLRPADQDATDELAKLKHGQEVRVEIKRMRNPRQHRIYWALISLIFDHQSRYATRDQLHQAIKVAVGYYDEIEGKHGRIAIPKSISFGNMPQAAFEEFFDAVVRLVVTKILPGTTDTELRNELEVMIGADTGAAHG